MKIEDFIQMGYEEEEAAHLVELQTWLQPGVEVGLIVDHHTDEDLNTELDHFIVENIDWETGQIRFVGSEGWAGFNEVYPLSESENTNSMSCVEKKSCFEQKYLNFKEKHMQRLIHFSLKKLENQNMSISTMDKQLSIFLMKGNINQLMINKRKDGESIWCCITKTITKPTLK